MDHRPWGGGGGGGALTLIGFMTSVMNWGCMYESRMRLCSRLRTVLVNLGLIFCGLYEMLKPGISTKWSSGFSMPASRRMNVVLPAMQSLTSRCNTRCDAAEAGKLDIQALMLHPTRSGV